MMGWGEGRVRGRLSFQGLNERSLASGNSFPSPFADSSWSISNRFVSLPASSRVVRAFVYFLAALWLCLIPGASVAGSAVVLSEFMASNASILADEDGDYPDWIEVHNVSATN